LSAIFRPTQRPTVHVLSSGSINRGENIEGLYAIGAATENPDGRVLGAFSVSGPRRVFADESRQAEIGDERSAIVD